MSADGSKETPVKNWLHDPVWFTPPDGRSRVLWKDAPSPPASPDYVGAANATAAGNIEAARAATAANRINQYTPYGSSTYTPPAADGGAWSQNIELSPTGRALLDALNGSQLGMASLQSGATDAVRDTMGRPFDAGGIPKTQTSLQTPGVQGSVAGTGMRSTIQNPGAQTSFDTSGVSEIPAVNDEARRRAEDMAYAAAKSRLDPEWNQRMSMQDTALRNQGLVAGGEAYDNAKRVSGQQQNDAYLQAQAGAVAQGLAAQKSQFDMGLAANRTGFEQAAAEAEFGNRGRAQDFGQELAAGNFYNQAARDQFAQNVGAGQFANQASGQDFNQRLAAGQFGNTAQQQALARELMLYNQPLNALSAIRSGSQVTNPTFPTYAQQQTTPGANLSGAAQAQGTWDQGIYNQGVGQANAFNNGLFSLGSAFLGMK